MTEEIDTAILTLLSLSPGYLSGEKIARELNLSRAAVWKRIQKFRKEGCRIFSSRNQGYQLRSIPDKLLPPFVKTGLNTSILARKIFYYPEVDSTNLRAKGIASQGVPDGTLVLTDYQIQGQGRLKRKWISPPEKNLLFSIIFYPSVSPPEVFQLTLLASLAVCKSLTNTARIEAGIKWPNDIYVGNRKICGILTEFSANPDRVNWAVVGMGINVNFDPSLDPEIGNSATSIKRETGKRWRRVLILQNILEEIDRLYQQFLSGDVAPIREEWLSHSLILGEPVLIIGDTFQEEGIAETIDENGALILRTSQGERKRIISGDLSLRIQEPEDGSQTPDPLIGLG